MRFFILLKRIRKDFYLISSIAVAYIINEIFLESFHIKFMQNYFNDLLAMPAMLAYINICLTCFKRKAIIDAKKILFVTIIIGFIWEIGALKIKPNSICDWLDFCCYIIGALVYKKFKEGE